MANIITKVPQIHTSEIGRQFERELRSGLALKRKTELERERRAAMEAQPNRGRKTSKSLGRLVNVMPAWEWFRAHQIYGHEEVHSREFHRFINKKHPDLKVSNV
jgi:hypothetical protein